MSRLSAQLKQNQVWSVAVFAEEADFKFQRPLGHPVLVLDAKKLRRRGRHVHTYADPFLFVFDEKLYLFLETQAVGEPGKIEAYRTADLRNFEPLGCVLSEDVHLSYPFVFRDGDGVFMIPETQASNEVALYRFSEFPMRLKKERVLLEGDLVDSSAIQHGDIWYLFTTSSRGLEIYFTGDLERGSLEAHPLNPITTDRRFDRCGGGPIYLDGELCRIAQDGSQGYGRNVNVLRIKELSETRYKEEVLVENYFDLNHSWNSHGGHHLTIADFKGKRVVAGDGKQNDFAFNKPLAALYKLTDGLRNRTG